MCIDLKLSAWQEYIYISGIQGDNKIVNKGFATLFEH